MNDDTQKPIERIYKSPLRKLLQLFKMSRDRWKAKCQEAKYKNKLLQNKIRYLEKNKDALKRKLKELENERDQKKIKAIQMEKDIKDQKKNL